MADQAQLARDSETALRAGHPREALSLLEDMVRRAPGRLEHRVRLFQVLVLLGEWDRARTQLQVMPEFDSADGELMVTAPALLAIIEAEAERSAVFAGRQPPRILGEPGAWVAQQADVVRLLAERKVEAAARAVQQVRESAPASAGRLDGEAFAWIADADPRLGPVLEVIIEKRYFWLPMERLRTVTFEAPTSLHDRVWIGAELILENAAALQAYVPVRYPGSEREVEDAVVMAAVSDWRDIGEGLSLGLGQRLLMTDLAEKPLFRTRRIEIDPAT